MARTRTLFVCQACGAEAARWAGQCVSCAAWNTLVETIAPARAGASRTPGPIGGDTPVALRDVDARLGERTQTGIAELDRVLGGGLVPGSVILIGGDPGVGKSTLLLQALCVMAAGGAQVLYVTGEEAPHQVRDRAARLGFADSTVQLLPETDLDRILAALEGGPGVAVVDSIQTVATADLESAPGSIGQLRESTARLSRLAKSRNFPLVLIGHVTKEGAIAGPKALEHMVDAVLYLEGERYSAFRVLRAAKNRFGSTNEIGVFQMAESGLAEVGNPSAFFLAERAEHAVGSAVIGTIEGSRPLLMEVQALTAPTHYGNPRRTATGVDYNRLMMLLAVLERRGGLVVGTHDVYVNIVGGMKVDEPAADLGVALAVASAVRDFAIPGDTVVMGEVGLSGEVRSVSQLERRLREAAQLGYARALIPRFQLASARKATGLKLEAIANVGEALAWAKIGG
jgi:DNA repair protein RadA/Sms